MMELTDSGLPPEETKKSKETIAVGNDEFLRTIFDGVAEGRCPVVVSFEGNPAEVERSAWFGAAWSPGAHTGVPGANNYFSLASFRPDDAGRYRRRKAQFTGFHAILLDDVGTKVPMDRVTLAPTWMIETSSGNFQVGYALRAPLTDGSLATRLVDATIRAGLCDPGANGPLARLVRLPVGANGKHTPAFPCVLTTWSPETRYTPEELIDGLDLELVAPGRPSRRTSGPTHPRPEDGDAI